MSTYVNRVPPTNNRPRLGAPPTRLVCLTAALLGAAASGCYEEPGTLGPEDALQLFASPSGEVAADGASTVIVTVTVDALTPVSAEITLETSSGVLDFSAEPGSAEARKLVVKNPGTGTIARVLRVGTTPGETLITARVGDFAATQSLMLAHSLPDLLTLTASPPVASADGATAIAVRAALFRTESERRVSQGTRVRFRSCCAAQDTGLPTGCDTADLLTLPALAELEEGQEIAINATPQRLESGGPRRIFVVAQVWGEGQGPLECAVEPGVVREQVPITLQPIAAAP